MQEPKFKVWDKATFRDESDRTDNPVTIHSDALRWADDSAHATRLYLVEHDNPERTQRPFLVLATCLTPAEEWQDCPGEHRVTASKSTRYYNMERLVGSER